MSKTKSGRPYKRGLRYHDPHHPGWSSLLTRAALILILVVRPAPRTFGAEGSGSTPVILISIDTLRADHLSVYGYQRIRTPHLDAFADHGTLFKRAEAQIPLTLPSHTSLFTSTYPFENHVEENGERVPAGILTLASVLRSQGYKTAAFIGSDFLDSRFGLDSGFDIYDSPFNEEAGPFAYPNSAKLRRDGALVARAAREYLEAHRGRPVFVFVHLYDLHTPYSARALAAGGRAVSPYDAALSYVDQVVGRFQQTLVAGGWWDRSLVVLLSDHGEGLGDHHEPDHGYFIYESTLWVPMIFHWPAGAQGYAAVAPEPAGLIDVAPTILGFLRVPVPREFRGASLLGDVGASGAGPGPNAVRPYMSRPVYSESLYAHDAFQWAPLRALHAGKYKLIQAPRAELFDLEADPHELTNLLPHNSAVAQELENELGKLLTRCESQAPKRPVGPPPETLATLETLGYLAAERHGENASSGPDPKDRLPEYELYQRALGMLEEGRAETALPLFRKVLATDSRNTLARFHLGECYMKGHQPANALREWTTALKLDPSYAPAAEAIGQYWLERGNFTQARQRFEQVLALAPDSFMCQFELGIAEERAGLLSEARQHLQAACRLEPRSQACARELQSLELKLK